MTCACTKHAGADGTIRLHPDAGCPEHGAIRGPRCACVVVSLDRAYPSPDCARCGGTGYAAQRPTLPIKRAILSLPRERFERAAQRPTLPIKRAILSLPRERFERAAGAARRASVLATGDDARDLAEIADQLEAHLDAPAAEPVSPTTITSHTRFEA